MASRADQLEALNRQGKLDWDRILSPSGARRLGAQAREVARDPSVPLYTKISMGLVDEAALATTHGPGAAERQATIQRGQRTMQREADRRKKVGLLDNPGAGAIGSGLVEGVKGAGEGLARTVSVGAWRPDWGGHETTWGGNGILRNLSSADIGEVGGQLALTAATMGVGAGVSGIGRAGLSTLTAGTSRGLTGAVTRGIVGGGFAAGEALAKVPVVGKGAAAVGRAGMALNAGVRGIENPVVRTGAALAAEAGVGALDNAVWNVGTQAGESIRRREGLDQFGRRVVDTTPGAMALGAAAGTVLGGAAHGAEEIGRAVTRGQAARWERQGLAAMRMLDEAEPILMEGTIGSPEYEMATQRLESVQKIAGRLRENGLDEMADLLDRGTRMLNPNRTMQDGLDEAAEAFTAANPPIDPDALRAEIYDIDRRIDELVAFGDVDAENMAQRDNLYDRLRGILDQAHNAGEPDVAMMANRALENGLGHQDWEAAPAGVQRPVGFEASPVPARLDEGPTDELATNQVTSRLYSQLARSVEMMAATPSMQQSFAPDQLYGVLKNKYQVKDAELEESGLRDWLQSQEVGKVSLQDALTFVQQNTPQIKVTLRGADTGTPTRWSGISAFQTGAQNQYGEMVLSLPGESRYTHGHWDDIDNPLLHVRFDTREGANGERILLVHELQSDWGQEGQHRGFVSQRDKDLAEMKSLMGEVEYPLTPRSRGEDPDSISVKDYDDLSVSQAGALHNRYTQVRQQLGEAAAEAWMRKFAAVSSRLQKMDYNVPEGKMVGNTDTWVNMGLKSISHWAQQNGYTHVAVAPGHDIAVGEGVRAPDGEGFAGGKGMMDFYDNIVHARLKDYAKKKKAPLTPISFAGAPSRGPGAARNVTVEALPLDARPVNADGADAWSGGDPLYMKTPEAGGGPALPNADGTMAMAAPTFEGSMDRFPVAPDPLANNPQTGELKRRGGGALRRAWARIRRDFHDMAAIVDQYDPRDPRVAEGPSMRAGLEKMAVSRSSAQALLDGELRRVTDGMAPQQVEAAEAWLLAMRLRQEIADQLGVPAGQLGQFQRHQLLAGVNGRAVRPELIAAMEEVAEQFSPNGALAAYAPMLRGWTPPGGGQRGVPAQHRRMWALLDRYHDAERFFFAEGNGRLGVRDKQVDGAPFAHMVTINDVFQLAQAVQRGDRVVVPQRAAMPDEPSALEEFTDQYNQWRAAHNRAAIQPDQLLDHLRNAEQTPLESLFATKRRDTADRLRASLPGTSRTATGRAQAYNLSLREQLGHQFSRSLEEAGRREFIDRAVTVGVAIPVRDRGPAGFGKPAGMRDPEIVTVTDARVLPERRSWALAHGVDAADGRGIDLALHQAANDQNLPLPNREEAARLLEHEQSYWMPAEVADAYRTMAARVDEPNNYVTGDLSSKATGFLLAVNAGEAGGHGVRILNTSLWQPQGLVAIERAMEAVDPTLITRTMLLMRNLVQAPQQRDYRRWERVLQMRGRMRSEQREAIEGSRHIDIPGISHLRDFVFNTLEPRMRVWYAMNLERLAQQNGVALGEDEIADAVFRFGVHAQQLMGRFSREWRRAGLDPFGGYHSGSRPGAIRDAITLGPKGLSPQQRVENFYKAMLGPAAIAAIITKALTGKSQIEQGANPWEIVAPKRNGDLYVVNLLAFMPHTASVLKGAGLTGRTLQGFAEGDEDAGHAWSMELTKGISNYGMQSFGSNTPLPMAAGAVLEGVRLHQLSNEGGPRYLPAHRGEKDTVDRRLVAAIENTSPWMHALVGLFAPQGYLEKGETDDEVVDRRFKGVEKSVGLPEGALRPELSVPGVLGSVPLPGGNLVKPLHQPYRGIGKGIARPARPAGS